MLINLQGVISGPTGRHDLVNACLFHELQNLIKVSYELEVHSSVRKKKV
jgi:hypothetical protein